MGKLIEKVNPKRKRIRHSKEAIFASFSRSEHPPAGQNQAAVFRGYPKAVRTDNGPEFTSRAVMGWAKARGILHLLIQPGKPMQNGYIESLNGKFRDKCLNEH